MLGSSWYRCSSTSERRTRRSERAWLGRGSVERGSSVAENQGNRGTLCAPGGERPRTHHSVRRRPMAPPDRRARATRSGSRCGCRPCHRVQGPRCGRRPSAAPGSTAAWSGAPSSPGQLTGVEGISDTQCGFKLFRRGGRHVLFPHAHGRFQLRRRSSAEARLCDFAIAEVPSTGPPAGLARESVTDSAAWRGNLVRIGCRQCADQYALPTSPLGRSGRTAHVGFRVLRA